MHRTRRDWLGFIVVPVTLELVGLARIEHRVSESESHRLNRTDPGRVGGRRVHPDPRRSAIVTPHLAQVQSLPYQPQAHRGNPRSPNRPCGSGAIDAGGDSKRHDGVFWGRTAPCPESALDCLKNDSHGRWHLFGDDACPVLLL